MGAYLEGGSGGLRAGSRERRADGQGKERMILKGKVNLVTQLTGCYHKKRITLSGDPLILNAYTIYSL
jgi:hypothetical protein